MNEFSGFACDACNAPAVVFLPGSQEVRELFLLQPGVPMRAWCLLCWAKTFGGPQTRSATP